jgi:hypothetical protein
MLSNGSIAFRLLKTCCNLKDDPKMRQFKWPMLVVLAACFSCSFQMRTVAQPPGPDKVTSKPYQYAEPHKKMWLILPSGHSKNYASGPSKFCQQCDHTVKRLVGKCPDPITGPCVESDCVILPNKPTLCEFLNFQLPPCQTCPRSGPVGCTHAVTKP